MGRGVVALCTGAQGLACMAAMAAADDHETDDGGGRHACAAAVAADLFPSLAWLWISEAGVVASGGVRHPGGLWVSSGGSVGGGDDGGGCWGDGEWDLALA